ncbi:MAG: FecR domain-containing protein [Bacteroidota bacterium]
MKYSKYDVFDFVEDEYFQEWVKKPDEETDFFWKSFISNHTNKVEMIAKAREILLSVNFKKYEVQRDEQQEVFLKILSDNYSALHHQSQSNKSQTTKLKNFLRIEFKSIAAVILFFLLALVVFKQLNNKEVVSIKEHVVYIERTIPKGQKKLIKLSDGSEIKINSEAWVTFPEKFIGNKREVRLIGEAYFKVVSNPERPFIVTTGDISTKVLGTSFNVKYQKDRNSVQVAVETGKVEVRNLRSEGLEKSMTLQPSEMVVYNQETPELVKQPFQYEDVFGWKDGILILEEGNIQDISKVLERWYGVEFKIFGSKEVHYSGGRFVDATLEEVMQGLSFTSKFSYKINGEIVEINL